MRRFLATIMLLLAGSAPASAQQPAEPRIELRYLDARGYPTIEAFFAVNDSDVDARSVVVEEDGRPLDAEVEGLRNEPIAVEVVLDSSSSMAGGKAGSVMAAMGQLLDIVRPFDVVGVVVFADTPAIAAPPGTSRDAVVSALKAYAPNGGTAFRDAVSLSIDQVAASPPARKVVIALSDGLDNRSAVDQEALIAKALANGVAVWTVGFGEPGAPADAGIDVASLEQLASRTGGQALITPDEATIRHGFRNVAAEVQSEFHVSVRSPRAADGTTRSLRFVFGGDEVTVKYNPGGVVPIPVPSVDAPASALGGPSIAARVSVASRWWLAGLGLLAAAAGVLLYGDAALRHAWFYRRWVRKVSHRSPDVGQVCANEGDRTFSFAVGERVVTCPACRSLHHFDCWQMNDQHCFTAHCRGATPARGLERRTRRNVRDLVIIGLAAAGAFATTERSSQLVSATLRAVPDDWRARFSVQITQAVFGLVLALCVVVPVRAFADAGHMHWRRATIRALGGALPTAVLAAASLVFADEAFKQLGAGAAARVTVWGLFGACVGAACLGGRLSYLLRGTAGGLIGGLVGGLLLLMLQRRWDPALAAIPGVALVAGGAALGAFGLARALERAWLEGIGGSVAGRLFPLDKYLGGRTGWAEMGSASRKVQLWAKELSDTHARIGLDGSHFVIEDLGGGVILDGTPVRRSYLRDASIITLGGAVFRYRERRR